MTVEAWRIVKSRRDRDAFSGEGAKLFGGRWNSPGRAVVYTAASVALAALEMLVHFDEADVLRDYSLLRVRFDDSLVGELSTPLPMNWTEPSMVAVSRGVGDAWIDGGRSAVLRVPSAIVTREDNYLLNPRHADFMRIEVGRPEPFVFDPRLFRTR